MCNIVQIPRRFLSNIYHKIAYKPKTIIDPVISTPMALINNNTSIGEFFDETNFELFPCSICGRTFNRNALSRHTPICQKLKRTSSVTPKRRDKSPIKTKLVAKCSAKPQQNENSTCAPSQCPTDNRAPASDLCPHCGLNIYEQHVALCEEKKIEPSNDTDIQNLDDEKADKLKPSAPSVASVISTSASKRAASRKGRQLKTCPYCERKFCNSAFERHVEFCRTKSDGPVFIVSTRNTQNDEGARQRMRARINYKPPTPRTR